MTPRSFLQNQLRDQERAKLAALPTDDVLTILLSQKQAFDSSLTALSGKLIGAKGLDLLASSTSAAAINAIGGSGGRITSDMVETLDAAKLTGIIDVARLPVIPGNNSIAATTISGLTTLQQATVSLGTMVYTADGGAWRYSGSEPKTSESSYFYTADVTPEWSVIANKPAFGSAAWQDATSFALAAQGAKADSALQPGASSDVLIEGSSKLFFTADRVRSTLLDGFNAVTSAVITAADSVIVALQKAQAQITAILAQKGAANGIASLGSDSRLVDMQFPNRLRSTLTFVASYDAIAETGWYRGNSTVTGAPVAASGVVRHMQYDASYAVQRYYRVSTREVYERQYIATVWTAWARVYSIASELDVRYQLSSQRGQANGYPSLDVNGLVPSSQLPVNGSYKGNWNANTNTPAIAAGVGTNGDEYTVSTAGTQSVTGTSTAFAIGDRLKFTTNGNKWERIPNSQAVASVFGRTGAIAAVSGDYSSAQVTHGAGTVAAALALLAPLASPSLTGTPTAPTAPVGTNTDQIATMAALKAGLDGLVAAAPGALDTLDELAAALGDDPNFRTTILNAIAEKEVAFDTLEGGAI